MNIKSSFQGCQLIVLIGVDTVIGKQGECWGLVLQEKLQEKYLLGYLLYPLLG